MYLSNLNSVILLCNSLKNKDEVYRVVNKLIKTRQYILARICIVLLCYNEDNDIFLSYEKDLNKFKDFFNNNLFDSFSSLLNFKKNGTLHDVQISTFCNTIPTEQRYISAIITSYEYKDKVVASIQDMTMKLLGISLVSDFDMDFNTLSQRCSARINKIYSDLNLLYNPLRFQSNKYDGTTGSEFFSTPEKYQLNSLSDEEIKSVLLTSRKDISLNVRFMILLKKDPELVYQMYERVISVLSKFDTPKRKILQRTILMGLFKVSILCKNYRQIEVLLPDMLKENLLILSKEKAINNTADVINYHHLGADQQIVSMILSKLDENQNISKTDFCRFVYLDFPYFAKYKVVDLINTKLVLHLCKISIMSYKDVLLNIIHNSKNISNKLTESDNILFQRILRRYITTAGSNLHIINSLLYMDSLIDLDWIYIFGIMEKLVSTYTMKKLLGNVISVIDKNDVIEKLKQEYKNLL